MRSVLVILAFGLFVVMLVSGCASSPPEGSYVYSETERYADKVREKQEAARVRITRNVDAVRGCTHMGVVSDDSFKDMQRKVVRIGGNVALIMAQEFVREPWLGIGSYSYLAEVYRCN